MTDHLTDSERAIAARCESLQNASWQNGKATQTLCSLIYEDVPALLTALAASRQRVAELEERVRELTGERPC